MSAPRTFVGSSGREDSPYAFFGEQPGKEEALRGRPFIGPAGKEFDKQLDMAGIPRAFSYISNAIKDCDEPPEVYIQLYDNKRLLRTPSVSEKGNFYLEFLRRELSNLSATCIVAVGGIALWALTGRTGIRNWRGSILDCEVGGVPIPGKKVVGILHPATVIPPKSQFLNRSISVHDLLRVKSIIEGTYIPTERRTFIRPSFVEAMEFLSYCKNEGLKGARVSYDIEVFMDRLHKQVSCISFAINNEGMSIPFADHEGDYFRLDDEIELWSRINEILSSPDIRKCGQNLVFDAHFLLRRYGICMTNADDTMIAAKTLTPDYPIGLDFLTSWWTDQPYYKRDGKDFIHYGGAYETFWKYNTLDSIVCSEIFPKQYEELTRQDNLAAYERQRLMIEPCCYMMERGLRVDVDAMFREASSVGDRIEKTQRDLEDIVGWDINPNSQVSLKRYFKDEKNVKPYKKRRADGTWGDTFDETAMKRLARAGFRDEATLILEKRRLVKQRSTYLDVAKVDPDNRLRCAYKPVGTRYSRLSSAENIFGTGGNQQNWPHDLQNFLLPDEDYVYYAFDLDQAENRIVAYVGEIHNMIEVFEKDIDVHAKTARMIVRVFLNQEADESFDTRQPSPIGDGTKDWRFWGKKSNHGFNYNLQYKRFSLVNEISEKEGRMIYDAYHNLYPGVRLSYHTYVRRCLRENRTLVNLLDRKTTFYDALNDVTYNEAYSCIPQGSVGDIINERGIEYIYYNQIIFKPVQLLRQVHDELGFQIPLSLPWHEHAYMLRLIKESLEIPLTTHYGRTFVIPASLTLGRCLNKDNKTLCREIPAKTFPADDEALAEMLSDRWRQTDVKA